MLLTRVTSRPLPLSPRWPLLDLRFVWLRPLSPRHRVPGGPLQHQPEHLCTPSRRLHGLAHGSPLCLRQRRPSHPVARSPLWPARAPQCSHWAEQLRGLRLLNWPHPRTCRFPESREASLAILFWLLRNFVGFLRLTKILPFSTVRLPCRCPGLATAFLGGLGPREPALCPPSP